MSKIKKNVRKGQFVAPQRLYLFIISIYLSLIAPAYSAVCFLPDSGDCGAGGFNVKDDPCEDKTTYTVAQFESKFKFTKDCYLHFEFEKDGETHICVDDKNVLDGFNMDYRGHCCKIGTSWCEEQQACAEHCCPSGQEWCPAQEKCVEHCCPSGEEWCDRLGKCATKEECTPTCDEPKIYIPTLNDCLCPTDRETDKNGNCCEVGEILNSNRECVEKAVCVGYTENKSKDENCWSCTACLDDPNKFKCEENIKDGYEIEAGKCVDKKPDPEPVSGCKGTEVMVGNKCVELAAYYPEKELSIENLLPYFTIESFVCPNFKYPCETISNVFCTKIDSNPLNIKIMNRLNYLRSNVAISSLRYISNGRIAQIAEAKEYVDGTLCMDDDCSTTASYRDLYKGNKKWAKGMKYHRNYYSTCSKAASIADEMKEYNKCDKGYLATKGGEYVHAVNGCLIDNMLGKDDAYVNTTHQLSFEEVADLYKKNIWKFDRSKYVFTFAIPDLDNNLEKYTLGNASGDEFAIVGNGGNQYVYFSSDMNNNETLDSVSLNDSGEKSELNIKNFETKVKSYMSGVDFNKGYPADYIQRTQYVQGTGNVDVSIHRSKTYYKNARFTFAGGLLMNTTIRTGTMTIKGDTTLNNVTIIADKIVFENKASLYVLGENNQIRGDRYSNGGSYSMHEATFSGSAGALYVDGGNITIYGKASEPVFSEIAVFGGKVQMFGYRTLSKKYSVKSSGQISLRGTDFDAYQYALQNFYYTDGESAPQSGVDATHYVVNDIIVGGNEEICSVLSCEDFGAYSKGKGWSNEYADEKRIQTVCDEFTDRGGNSFECVTGSMPMYCGYTHVDENNLCRNEIYDTYLPDYPDAYCAEISSEQEAQSKCQEVIAEGSDYWNKNYTLKDTIVKPFGRNGSKKCAICLYDSTEGQ